LVNAKYSLAQTYFFKGDKQSAESLYREILDYAVRNLGESDAVVGDVSNELANLIRDRDYENAIALYRQSERIIRPIPEEKPDLATTLSNLGLVLTDAGRFDEAETVLNECLAIRREIFGNESPTLSVSMVRLSRVYFYRGDYAQAETLARQAIAIQEKNHPKGHRNFAFSYTTLGKILTHNGKLAEAEKLLREGLKVSREKLGAQDRQTAIAESALGECLARQKRFAEAEPLLQKATNP
jgi:serine/threonine-protein kinase